VKEEEVVPPKVEKPVGNGQRA
jgi:hypothetical protein